MWRQPFPFTPYTLQQRQNNLRVKGMLEGWEATLDKREIWHGEADPIRHAQWSQASSSGQPLDSSVRHELEAVDTRLRVDPTLVNEASVEQKRAPESVLADR